MRKKKKHGGNMRKGEFGGHGGVGDGAQHARVGFGTFGGRSRAGAAVYPGPQRGAREGGPFTPGRVLQKLSGGFPGPDLRIGWNLSGFSVGLGLRGDKGPR